MEEKENWIGKFRLMNHKRQWSRYLKSTQSSGAQSWTLGLQHQLTDFWEVDILSPQDALQGSSPCVHKPLRDLKVRSLESDLRGQVIESEKCFQREFLSHNIRWQFCIQSCFKILIIYDIVKKKLKSFVRPECYCAVFIFLFCLDVLRV